MQCNLFYNKKNKLSSLFFCKTYCHCEGVRKIIPQKRGFRDIYTNKTKDVAPAPRRAVVLFFFLGVHVLSSFHVEIEKKKEWVRTKTRIVLSVLFPDCHENSYEFFRNDNSAAFKGILWAQALRMTVGAQNDGGMLRMTRGRW